MAPGSSTEKRMTASIIFFTDPQDTNQNISLILRKANLKGDPKLYMHHYRGRDVLSTET